MQGLALLILMVFAMLTDGLVAEFGMGVYIVIAVATLGVTWRMIEWSR